MSAPAPTHAPATVWAARLWDAVLVGDEAGAGDVLRAALDTGIDAESVVLDVVGAVQRKVGEEWAADRIDVAREHMATAINDRALAVLHRHAPPATPTRGRVTVACVDGEWHSLPARLLTEVLVLRGWRVDHLGAQVPLPHLIAHVRRTGPDVVALSASIATRLPTAHAAISACRALGVPVMAGGAAFGPDGRHARLLGADAWAPHARAAADRLELAPLSGPLGGRHPYDDLPHLADQEYTLITRTAKKLVRETLVDLESRLPGMSRYTEAQRRYAATDIAHIVDFLGAALYTDDDDLFADFTAWTAGVLTARAVPVHSLSTTLDVLGRRLRDFPRATRLITLARTRPSAWADFDDPGTERST